MGFTGLGGEHYRGYEGALSQQCSQDTAGVEQSAWCEGMHHTKHDSIYLLNTGYQTEKGCSPDTYTFRDFQAPIFFSQYLPT
jgi:hypothetical protein